VNENATRGSEWRGAESEDSGTSASVPFDLLSLERVNFGSKRATAFDAYGTSATGATDPLIGFGNAAKTAGGEKGRGNN